MHIFYYKINWNYTYLIIFENNKRNIIQNLRKWYQTKESKALYKLIKLSIFEINIIININNSYC